MKGDYLMELFCQWCIMLLGIFGLVQLSELIFIWMRRPQQKPPVFSVLPLSGKVKNPEQTLTYFQEVALWSPESQLAFVLLFSIPYLWAVCKFLQILFGCRR